MDDVAQAGSSARPEVTLYWRPGCGFCARLMRELDGLSIPADRRNIWEDEEAAAFVRSVARGNETVPTVVVGQQAMVNPRGQEVVAALRRQRTAGSPPVAAPEVA
jgi:glutaredoxin-like protein